MADNVPITSGSGISIGADEITAVKYQRIKLITGIDGVNDGDVAATNPFPITGSTTLVGTVTITGSTAIVAALPAGTNAIGKLAANSGVDIGDVDVLSMPAITGSVAVVNTVAITGSTTIASMPAITGSVAVVNSIAVASLPAVTGSVAVVNTVTITGSTTIASMPAITGSVTVVNSAITVTDGRQVVAATGSAISIGTLACYKVVVVGETDNTGIVVVGGTTSTAVLATRTGVPIYAAQSQEFECSNLNQLYIDSTVAGEGLTYIAYT